MSDLATTNQRVLSSIEELIAPRSAGPDRPGRQSAADCPDRARRSAPRVLCIDDDREFIEALQRRLESRGIAVLRATTGLDGSCYALGEPTDAILLDFQLPNGCGDYILNQLKVNQATKDIPVIVISGSKDRALEYTLVNGGAVRYLHKPLDFEELMTELRKYLSV